MIYNLKLMYLRRLDTLSVTEIQKYNGKSVKSLNLVNFVLSDRNLIIVFKTNSIKASDEIKLRFFLKKYRIFTKRYKRKDISFFERFVEYPLERKNNFSDFLKFMDGSGFILVFEDLSHYLFFETNLLSKLLKFKFFPILLKSNNQYFFFNSTSYNITKALVKNTNFNTNLMFSFSFFQLLTIRNFLYFLLFFKFQSSIYIKIL